MFDREIRTHTDPHELKRQTDERTFRTVPHRQGTPMSTPPARGASRERPTGTAGVRNPLPALRGVFLCASEVDLEVAEVAP